MSKQEYKDIVGTFVFDRLSCLRNEYAHNECSKCMQICPEEALKIQRKKLRLDANACTACGVCIGSCPTNSLYIVEDSLEKSINKILTEDVPMLSCENQKYCLARFNWLDFTILALESEKEFACNLGACKTCELNQNNKALEFIENSLYEANVILKTLHVKNISKSYEQKEHSTSRRAFFRKLAFSKAKNKFEAEKDIENSLIRVKKSIKEKLLHVKNTEVNEKLSFAHFKSINNSCTNCAECIDFCPTNALSYNHDKSVILFQMGKCIGCQICEDICKYDSIKTVQKEFNLAEFAYNKAEVLIKHNIKVCKLCKCAFSYKKGELLCDRCATFENENSDIFTLACDK